jgi:hypothetical protein
VHKTSDAIPTWIVNKTKALEISAGCAILKGWQNGFCLSPDKHHLHKAETMFASHIVFIG